MFKSLLLFSLLIFSIFTTQAQINFEKGYFIDNSNHKVEALIKNADWYNNPTQFLYKLSEEDEPQKASIETVREFGIYNSAKYIRSTVNIDRSSENFYHLSTSRLPEFEEEQLYLKVIIEGKASLYEYTDEEKKFFYKKDDSAIEQLIFKTYKTPEARVFENKSFQQQLYTNLDCTNITLNRIQKLKYAKSSLKKFFADYNECQNVEYQDYEEKSRKILFGLSIRPRLNLSTLAVRNSSNSFRNTDFGGEYNPGIGLEAEFILPFNKNKWAVIIEPTYQQYEVEKITQTRPVHGRTQIANADYQSLEIPLGVRHYFFLSDNSRIFLNAAYLIDFPFGSMITFDRPDGTSLGSVEILRRSNFLFGTGYNYKNFSLELRYQPSGHILGNYLSWSSTYKTASVIIGYSFL